MYLEKIELQGFKSFAPKTTLHFQGGNNSPKDITAIVGPNGSGKSNVADAIRWVLGEQSTKLLRGKKGDDVIFFGSEKKGRLGFCEVSLFFNNENHSFPLEYAEIVITRRIYRDESSEYFLNKQKTTLSEITLLLAQAKVGQKSYSVIGQGMIDTIINASPAERTAFFYEAAGVREYQIKKHQSELKLATAQTNLEHAVVQLSELTPRLRYLKRQIERQEKKAALQKEFAIAARHYYNGVWNTRRDQLSHCEKQLKESLGQLRALQESYQKLTDSFEEIQRGDTRAIDDQYQAAQRTVQELQRKKNNLTQELSIIEGRMKMNLDTLGAIDIGWLTTRVSGLEDELGQLVSQEDVLQKEHETKQQENVSLQEKRTLWREKIRALESEIQHTSTPSEKELLSVLFQRLTTLQSKRKDLSIHTDHEKLSQFTTSLFDEIEGVLTLFSGDPKEHERNAEIMASIEELRSKEHELARAEGEVQVALRVLSSQKDQLRQQKAARQQELEKARREISFFNANSQEEKLQALQGEQEKITAQKKEVETQINSAQAVVDSYHEKQKDTQKRLGELQNEMHSVQQELNRAQQSHGAIELKKGKLETLQEELQRRMGEDLEIEYETRSALAQGTEDVYSLLGFDPSLTLDAPHENEAHMARLKNQIAQIGTIDQTEIEEYEAVQERHAFLEEQSQDLSKALVSLQEAIKELEELITTQFTSAMKGINREFETYFTRIFGGGSAKLTLSVQENEEEHTPEVEGVDIQVTPPGKKVKHISVLSGGEKAMTAIALISAIMHHNPSPFVVLDEVDAALDEANAHKFALILGELASKTQFIVITHNRVTMHMAQRLYGVTMGQEGISQVVSIDIAKVSDIVTSR